MDALIEYYYGLNYWSLESRFTEDGTFCTMRYVWQSLFMLITDCVLSLVLQVWITVCIVQVVTLIHWIDVKGKRWDKCSVPTPLRTPRYCHALWLLGSRSLCKKTDWVHTGLTRIARSQLYWGKTLGLFCLFVCSRSNSLFQKHANTWYLAAIPCLWKINRWYWRSRTRHVHNITIYSEFLRM